MTYKMNTEAREALVQSIRKWEGNEEVLLQSSLLLGPADCPLCNLYNVNIEDKCKGCPVAAYTGSIVCNNSPYSKVEELYDTRGEVDSEMKEAIQDETNFLREVLEFYDEE